MVYLLVLLFVDADLLLFVLFELFDDTSVDLFVCAIDPVSAVLVLILRARSFFLFGTYIFVIVIISSVFNFIVPS
jgi:hypothetical protein